MAPSPAGPLDGTGVQRIWPSKPSSSTQSTGSVVGITGPVQETIYEPYETPWNMINRKRSRRSYKQQLNLDELFNNEKHFEKYYNIKFPGLILERDINILKTDKDLLNKIGKPEKITRSGKNILLVKARTPEQAGKICALTHLDGNVVYIEPHRKFNGTKGVIRSKTMSQSTEEELLEHLKDQGVREIRRVKVKKNGELIETNTYIVTFGSSECPRAIKLTEWHFEKVEEYKYRPQQCFKCQRFGHVAKYCRSEQDTCSNCGEAGHKIFDCSSDTSCYHCKSSHLSSSRICPKYESENKIIDTQMRLKIPRFEAMEIVFSNNPELATLYSTRTTQQIGTQLRENLSEESNENNLNALNIRIPQSSSLCPDIVTNTEASEPSSSPLIRNNTKHNSPRKITTVQQNKQQKRKSEPSSSDRNSEAQETNPNQTISKKRNITKTPNKDDNRRSSLPHGNNMKLTYASTLRKPDLNNNIKPGNIPVIGTMPPPPPPPPPPSEPRKPKEKYRTSFDENYYRL